MDTKKVEYLKKHLEQALSEENYGDVNYCFQELSNIPNIDISELAKEVEEFNKIYRSKVNENALSDLENLKAQMCQLNAKIKKISKIGWRSFFSGMIVSLLGFILFFIYYNYSIHYIFDEYLTLYFGIIGLIVMFIGIVFLCVGSKINAKADNIRKKLFNELCFSQEKFKYLDNIDVLNDITGNPYYKGQIVNGKQEGFGIYLDKKGYFYIGEWLNGEMSGIGKLISDDFKMVLEGEFLCNRVNGIVDITWDDGSEWHGEYKQGSPWNGKGKAILPWHGHKVLEGSWVNGERLK